MVDHDNDKRNRYIGKTYNKCKVKRGIKSSRDCSYKIIPKKKYIQLWIFLFYTIKIFKAVESCQKLMRLKPSVPVPTRLICCQPTPIIGQLQSADSSGFRILNGFNKGSRETITKSVVQSADSMTNSSSDLARIGIRVWALRIDNSRRGEVHVL